jgi:hypothetical protein
MGRWFGGQYSEHSPAHYYIALIWSEDYSLASQIWKKQHQWKRNDRNEWKSAYHNPRYLKTGNGHRKK